MLLTLYETLLKNLTIQNLDILIMKSHFLKSLPWNGIDIGRLKSFTHKFCRCLGEKTLYTEEHIAIYSKVLRNLLVIFIVILTHETFMKVEEVRTNLIFRQNHLTLGEFQRNKDALEDIQFLMSHSAIPSCKLTGYVTNWDVKVFHQICG